MQFRTCRNHAVSRKSNPRIVSVLDPVFRTGLLDIPIEKTSATKGRDEWLEGRLNKDLSLCCLFQKGRCHAGERCFQVHVDRDFMASIRDQQSKIVSCCRKCNDTASLTSQSIKFFAANVPSNTTVCVSYQNGASRSVECSLLAFTAGLVQQFEEHGARVENNVLPVPSRRICRLHMKGCCKYGKDCKNVHVCSKLGENFLVAPALEVVAPVVVTAPKVAAEVVSPPMTSFAPPSYFAAVNPLGFGINDRNAVSLSVKSMDAVDLCEGSRLLKKSFFFDATCALEDSGKTQEALSASSSIGCANDSIVSFIAASSPGQKRRGSSTSSAAAESASRKHALHLDAFHPCSQVASTTLPACRISNMDQMSLLSMFA